MQYIKIVASGCIVKDAELENSCWAISAEQSVKRLGEMMHEMIHRGGTLSIARKTVDREEAICSATELHTCIGFVSGQYDGLNI